MAKKKKEMMAPEPDNDYEADSALDTLTRAEEIKQDKELMKRVAKKAGRKMKAITGLSDLISKHTKKKPRSIEDLKRARDNMGD